jgi:mannose-6-phosphate isomerase-like protein (cupin superfamily)
MTFTPSHGHDGHWSGNDFVYSVGNDIEPLRLDMWVPAGTRLPALHAHPHQRECFSVMSGRFDVRVADEAHQLGPGETITVEPDIMHGVGNVGEGAAVVYTEITPGLRTQSFFEELRALEGRRLTGLREIIAFAMLARRYQREYRYSAPVTLLFRVSSGLGRFVLRPGRADAEPSTGLDARGGSS